MEAFVQDVKHALRMFAQHRAFTAAAVAALALGIGANTAIFSVVNAVLLKPVPFFEPDRLVMFMNTSPQGSGPNASPAKFQHWREQTTVVQHAAAFRTNVLNYTDGEVPEQVRAAQVSADYSSPTRSTPSTRRSPRWRGRSGRAASRTPSALACRSSCAR